MRTTLGAGGCQHLFRTRKRDPKRPARRRNRNQRAHAVASVWRQPRSTPGSDLALVRRGLLVRPPRQRARVATVTQEEINQVLQLREAVEGLSAREAAKHITTEEIASLRAALARQEERSRAVGAEALVQHEPGLDFHAAIASASRNVFVLKFLQEDFYAMIELCRRRQRRDPCGMPARSSITVVSSTPWRIAILNSPSY
jgi:hypothetical protein